jgi:hypothetical protein
MRKQGQTITSLRFVSTRDMFKNRLSTVGSSPKALKESSEKSENIHIKNCLNGAGCVPQKKLPFALYDAMGAFVAGAGENNPARYTIDGTPCTTKSTQCPLEVFTEVSVACKTTPCGIPSDLKIHYTIRQAPGINIPGSARLKMASDTASSVQLSQMAALTSGVACYEKGEVLRGILPDGRPDCTPITNVLGLRSVKGIASERRNPNPRGGKECGWAPLFAGQARMQHVVGTVCCDAGEVAVGGGGVCNHNSGGFLESSKPLVAGGRSCWFVDCCKYPNFEPSPIWVQCIAAPNINFSTVIPEL